MSRANANPYDALELDPSSSVASLTASLRERTEGASDAEKVVLREAWEELTLHAERRLWLALTAFPETRDAVSAVPAPTRPPSATEAPLDLLDFIDPLRLDAIIAAPTADEAALAEPPTVFPARDTSRR